MAKKPKTPPPPKPQAPQRRGDPRTPRELEARHRAILYWVAGAGIVALIAVVVLVAFGGGGGSGKSAGDKNVARLMAAAGCTYRTNKTVVPNGKTHIQKLTGDFHWTTSPPDGGAHYPAWAVWGFYTEAVNPRMVVHNEEHGGVILWWGPQVPPATVSALHAFYNEQPDGTFGTPYKQLGSRIAITAWTGNPSHYQQNGDFGQGHIGTCPQWNGATKKAFEAFRSAFRGHGPEGVPLSADEPGMGPQ